MDPASSVRDLTSRVRRADPTLFVREEGPAAVTVALRDLPKYLVLDPLATVRITMRLEAPACEIDVELDNPAPGRSFVLLIGHPGGPFVQRVRLAGKARIFFDPESEGEYLLLLVNPQREPLVVRLRGRDIGKPSRVAPPETPRVTFRRPRPAARSPRARGARPGPGVRRARAAAKE
jgi:hypothetical protein